MITTGVILELGVVAWVLFAIIKYMALEGRPLMGVMKCFFRGSHRPMNIIHLGMFKCSACKLVGRHLGEFGGSGYVSHIKTGMDEKGHYTREQR